MHSSQCLVGLNLRFKIKDRILLYFDSFQNAYHGRAQTALPYAMNSEFSRVLSGEMVSILCTSLEDIIEYGYTVNSCYTDTLGM